MFLTAQSDDPYYLWQLELQLYNFKSLGIDSRKIHVLLGYDPILGLRAEAKQLIEDKHDYAVFFIYMDDRARAGTSLKPHIVKKHFIEFPCLQEEAIFYYDCHVIFSRLPMFSTLLNDKYWYLPDSKAREGNNCSKCLDDVTIGRLAQTIDIDPEIICDHSYGGYMPGLVKNASIEFWGKVEKDSETLCTYLHDNEDELACALTDCSIYGPGWLSDMWAFIWNAYRFGYVIRMNEALNFSRPDEPLSEWGIRDIYQNNQVTSGGRLFDKGRFVKRTPFFNSYESTRDDVCQAMYMELLHSYEENYRRDLSDVTFLFQVKGDSPERIENIRAAILHLNRFFTTSIEVVEVGTSQHLSFYDSDNIGYEFIYNEATFLNFAKYWNLLCNKASTPFIVLHDADIIVNPEQMYQAIVKLRHAGYALCLPYDGEFVTIDEATRRRYLSDRNLSLLSQQGRDTAAIVHNSVGGCVALNRATFKQAGGSNEGIVGWGPDDKERLARMKILGHKTGRISGAVYHLHHPRTQGSTYASPEIQIKGFKEYLKVCAMSTEDLATYIKSW